MRIAFIYDVRENVFGLDSDGLVNELTTELFSASEANDIITALKELGHAVTVIDGAREFVSQLPGIRERFDFVFNEAKGLFGPDRKMAVPALCRIHAIPFLGSDGYSVTLCRNKFHTLAVASLSGVQIPESRLAWDPDASLDGWTRWPAIVKPNFESASIGISTESVVRGPEELRRQVEHVIETYEQPALIQAFISGIEVQVSIVGNHPATPLPPTSLQAVADASNPFGIVRNADWTTGTVVVSPYRNSGTEDNVSKMAETVFRALGCSDYARLDFRVDPNGDAWFIEAATHPHIVRGSAFAEAAALRGLTYTEMIRLLVETSVQRQRPFRSS